MARDLRQSTNSQVLKLGPFISDSDFVTKQTTLTIAQADVKLSKNGAALAQKADTSDAVYDTDGFYAITLNASDTDTLGRLRVEISKTGCLPSWDDIIILSQAAYDSKYSASALALKTDTDAILAAVNGQGPVATVPTSGSNVISGNVVSGTYINTQTLDGVAWRIQGTGSVAAVVELTYATGAVTNKPVRVDLYGYYNVNGPVGSKACEIWAWNYTSATYVQVSNSTTHFGGTTGTTVVLRSIILSTDFLDPATGNAKIKFVGNDTATTSIIAIDYAPYYYQAGGNTLTDIAKAVWQYNPYIAYNGTITVDTVNGFPGQDLGIHGLPTHPSSNMADAFVLAGLLGVKRLTILTESLTSLTQTLDGWVIGGWEFYLNMNGQTLTDTSFSNCHVYGVGTCDGSSDMHFDNCYIASNASGWATATVCMAVARHCYLGGVITLASGINIFDTCRDGTNSTTEPEIVFLDSAEAQFRDWDGGLKLSGLAVGNDVLVTGRGRVIINSACTGGKVTIRGDFPYPKDENGDDYVGDVTVSYLSVLDDIVTTSRHSGNGSVAKVLFDTYLNTVFTLDRLNAISAPIVYVDGDDGDDANSGVEAEPVLTIAYAMTLVTGKLNARVRIRKASGPFIENVVMAENVVLERWGGGNAQLQADQFFTATVTMAKGSTLDNVEIIPYNGAQTNVFVTCETENATVQRCVLGGNAYSDGVMVALGCVGGKNLTIKENIFLGDSTGNSVMAIFGGGCFDVRIVDNVIVNYTSNFLHFLDNSDLLDIRDNTFIGVGVGTWAISTSSMSASRVVGNVYKLDYSGGAFYYTAYTSSLNIPNIVSNNGEMLADNEIPELTLDPGATPTVSKAIMLQYMKLRNKETSTASAITISNNMGVTILTAGLTDDGTTLTKAQIST